MWRVSRSVAKKTRDTCSAFFRSLKTRVDTGLRAGIDTAHYRFISRGRERNTILFVGSFQHSPNVDALSWFTSKVFPRIVELWPEAILVVIGSYAAPRFDHLNEQPNIRFVGFVPDVRRAFGRMRGVCVPGAQWIGRPSEIAGSLRVRNTSRIDHDRRRGTDVRNPVMSAS